MTTLRRVLAALGVVGALGVWPPPADAAGDENQIAAGSIRLRGGFDANPRLLPGGRGSAIAGVDGAFAIARERGDLQLGLAGEIERTEHVSRGIEPSERASLAAEARSGAFENWSLRAGTRIENERSATLQAFDATQRVRAQWTGGDVRPFVSAELGYHTLNETNAIFTGFLPEPQRFGRATITPGVTAKLGSAEIGASVAVSATRYAEALDVFGYRRENERVQPFLFARYEGQGLAVSASVSQLYGFWHDADFSRVNTTLFDVALSKTAGRWTLDLGSSRIAADTSFPISPLAITQSESARLSYRPDDAWTIAAQARRLRTQYLDTPLVATTAAYGIALGYEWGGGWSLEAEVLRIAATAINGEAADGGLATLSLTKRFAAGGSEKRWAPSTPPTASRLSPQSLKSRSLSSAITPRPAYQPP